MKKKRSKKTNNKRNSRISGALMVLFLILVAVSFAYPFPEQETIPINQVVLEINSEKIKKLIISDKVQVFYQNEEQGLTLKEPNSTNSFVQSLLDLGVDPEKLTKIEIEFKENSGFAVWVLPVLITLLPPIIIFFFIWRMFSQAKTGSMQALDFTKAKAKLFGPDKQKQKTTFKDVAGLEEAKEELKEIIDFLKNPKKYFQIGAKIPRGVLLVGPPGCGKTLLARAIAHEANVPFFSIAGSEFIEMFVGVGSSRVRSLFTQTKKAGKAILFIDEIDSIGKARSGGFGGGYEEREQTLNQLLTEMDGFDQTSEVIVIGATNKPESLDAALLRPGRFDRRIILDLPDIKDRKEVLEIHAKNKPLSSDIDFREIAERTPGFSGADLENLMNEAAILAARKNQVKVSQAELIESIEKVLLGPERRSHILNEKEKEITAYHEAGHALVAASLPGTEEVRKISIVARGLAAGYTLQTPKQEKRMKTKSEFLSELSVLLGGYVAEKIKYKDITTGASNDLKRASAIARKLVKEWGMSSLGPIVFGEKDELSFLAGEAPEKRNYSEEMAFRIDKEITLFIKQAQSNAEKILNSKRKTLDKIAKALIEKETIEKQEFEKIIKNG